MTYDPKHYPGPHLPGVYDPQTGGYLSVSTPENHMEPVQPSALEKFLAVAKPIAALVITVAGGILAMGQGGITLPAWLVAVCTSLVSIGAGLGIASSGVQKPALPAPAPQDTLK